MANLSEESVWEAGIYQIEKTDPVIGGAPNLATKAGLSNIPHQQLARRTTWLKTQVDGLIDTVVAATTAVAGIVKLSSSVNSTSETLAATPAAVKAVNDNANGRVPNSRTVTGGGLATGGGALSANQVITVTAATQAEAEAGTAVTRAMTPLATKQAIDSRLSSAVNSTSETLAATPAAVKAVNDNANGRVPNSRTVTVAGSQPAAGLCPPIR